MRASCSAAQTEPSSSPQARTAATGLARGGPARRGLCSEFRPRLQPRDTSPASRVTPVFLACCGQTRHAGGSSQDRCVHCGVRFLHTAVIRQKRILTRALKLIEGESTRSGSGDAAVGILLALARWRRRWLSWLGGKFFLFKNPGSVSTLAMHLPFNQRPLSPSSAWSPCAAPPCPGRIDAHLACCPRSAPVAPPAASFSSACLSACASR